jgi:hypothetical protein
MRDLQPSMAARFGTHLWSRGFLKARIGPPLSSKFAWNNRKQKKFCSILTTDEEKARRFPKEQIIPTPELELLAVFRTGGGMTWCPRGLARWWRNYSALLAVMNKQPTLEPDGRKRPSRPKLHDLQPKKDLKGGSSAKSVASANGSSGIPRSLQEFLKRDSLPIKSD